MKKIFTIIALAMTALMAAAQEDPIVMTINGVPVPRSEFEYNYNKNNTDGVIDKKSVREYAELFVNYKLKVQAALDDKLDTLTSFQKEFRTYRDQQIRPLLIPQGAREREVRAYYDGMVASMEGKDLIQPAHILLRLMQTATAEEQAKVKARIDSAYQALQQGADFAELAKQISEDPQTAVRGGLLPWIGPNQTVQEFEDAAYALKVGETSQPVLSPVGYHIIKLMGQKSIEPYDSLRTRIANYLDQRGLDQQLSQQVIDSLANKNGEVKTMEQILDEKTEELCAKDMELKYLVKEYYDGLLLFEECNRKVWDVASKDTVALENYFKKNKKKYAWDVPHFRGAIFYCLDEADLKRIPKLLKKKAEEDWTSTVRETFNKDSVTVRIQQSLFKMGESQNVDRLAFKQKDKELTPFKQYDKVTVMGKVLKKGPELWTDVANQVTNDYQRHKEEEFVAELRKRYTFEIDEKALETVNNH